MHFSVHNAMAQCSISTTIPGVPASNKLELPLLSAATDTGTLRSIKKVKEESANPRGPYAGNAESTIRRRRAAIKRRMESHADDCQSIDEIM